MIYIITPVFNRINFTKTYLEALSKQTATDFKTIIVDDGSVDGTSDMIQNDFPEVVLLKKKGGLWWSEATNIGIKFALEHGAEYIMTLNDDTLPASDYMEKMILWSKKKPSALLGALALGVHDNKIVYGGEMLNWKSGKFENIIDLISDSNQNGLHKVNIFPGRGLLIPADVFNEIGFYDSKNFPQTVADLDFTVRANNAGYEIFCNYDAKIRVYTEESASVKLNQNRSLKNYYKHLFSMKGGANLKWFTIFAFKNAPRRYVFQYWAIGVLKRIFGYPIKWFLEKIK
jgi:GT2 family glycosyltransferase